MKLIDKSALLAEIERLVNNYDKALDYEAALEDVRNFINTLEVKEVDLEDAKKEELAQEYVDYTFKRHNIDANSRVGQLIYYAYKHGMNQCLNQLKAQKGE